MDVTLPQAITSQVSQQFEESRNLASDIVHMALNYGISKGVVQQTGVKDVYSVQRRVHFTLPPQRKRKAFEEEDKKSLAGKRGCLKRESLSNNKTLRCIK
jgi:hypothetical protein